jgi:uncharacterized protein (DUF362 family)
VVSHSFSRRRLFNLAAGGFLVSSSAAKPQQVPPPLAAVPVRDFKRRSTVVLVDGKERGRMVHDALLALDDQILPKLRTRKRVVIKPNNVSTEIQLASTHADTLRAVLEYLGPRFKGPITIAEASAGDTWTGFRNFQYTEVAREYKSMQVELVDLNQEARYEQFPLLDGDLHPVPVRLAARLVDPDTFVIGTAILKAHNYYVATLSVKNMVLGAPLHNAPGETERWSDKRRFHVGYHVGHYNMLTTAQALLPQWGVALIDGFEGMEGNGPVRGTAVPSRLAIASTDFIAADRVGVECMGLDPRWVGYLQYCGQVGVGNYDLAKIDVLGATISSLRRTYRLHDSIERQMHWMGPTGLTSPA